MAKMKYLSAALMNEPDVMVSFSLKRLPFGLVHTRVYIVDGRTMGRKLESRNGRVLYRSGCYRGF